MTYNLPSFIRLIRIVAIPNQAIPAIHNTIAQNLLDNYFIHKNRIKNLLELCLFHPQECINKDDNV